MVLLQLIVHCHVIITLLQSVLTLLWYFIYRPVLPHLHGVDNYAYIAVLGRGHFGKVNSNTTCYCIYSLYMYNYVQLHVHEGWTMCTCTCTCCMMQ